MLRSFHRSFLLAACLTAVPTLARAIDFVFGYDGVPSELRGSPGEVIAFDVFATLDTRNDPTPDGAEGWSAIFRVEGASIEEVSVDGLTVSTIYVPRPGTKLDPYSLDLARAGFLIDEVSTLQCGAGPASWGIEAVVLHLAKKVGSPGTELEFAL